MVSNAYDLQLWLMWHTILPATNASNIAIPSAIYPTQPTAKKRVVRATLLHITTHHSVRTQQARKAPQSFCLAFTVLIFWEKG